MPSHIRLRSLLIAVALLVFGPFAVPPAPALAATPTSAPLRVASYNVCGNYVADCRSDLDIAPWADSVVEATYQFGPDVLMMQELCEGQLNALKARMTGYIAVWTPAIKNHPGCGKWNVPASGGGDVGLGMLVRAASVLKHEAELPLGDPNGEVRPLQCATATLAGRTAQVCNTHLSSELVDHGTAKVVELARKWAGGVPVVVGGDFNADPQDPKLDVFYRLQGGTGTFTEFDETDAEHFGPDCRRQSACRTGQATTLPKAGKPPRKFDYLFADTARFLPVEGDAVDVVRAGKSLSDHMMLRTTLSWNDDQKAPSAPLAEPATLPVGGASRGITSGDFNRDGREDLVVLGRDGSLVLRPGAPGGTGQPVTLVSATGGGWSDARSVTAADFNGDGHTDLLVRWAAGSVFLYPGNGQGGLAGSVHVRPAGAWSEVTETVAADVNGDGRSDAVTLDGAGRATVHTGVADAATDVRVPLPAPSEAVTALDVVASADLGVVVRWSDGSATRHPAVQGALGAPVTLVGATGGGWSDARSVTGGDFNGDGRTDLLVRWAAGSAFLYPGNGQGGLGGSVPMLVPGSLSDAVDVAGVRATGPKADILVRRSTGGVDLYPADAGKVQVAPPARAGEPYRIPVRSVDDRGRVAAYEYTLNYAQTPGRRVAAGADRTELVLTPTSAGRHTLYVTALDLAGNRSEPLTYVFDAEPPATSGGSLPADFTADGRADLLVRWKAGSVFLYPGNGQGGLGGSVPVLPAGAWNGVLGVASGEFTGDSVADAMVIAGDGSAALHPGDGQGIGAAPLPVLPAGALSGAVGVSAGDFNGDRAADLIVRWNDGAVTLHPGDGRAGLTTAVQLRPAGAGGWSDARSVTGGDFNGDGLSDLLVRWSAGSVFLYPGNGQGGLGGSVPLLPAGSWSDAVDITAGLFTADTKSDVLIRWNDGSVTVHPSNGTGFDGPLPIRPTGEWLDTAGLS